MTCDARLRSKDRHVHPFTVTKGKGNDLPRPAAALGSHLCR